MGGSSKETTQTTSSGPWSGAADDLNKILNQAKKLNKKDKGFNAYPGEGYVPFSSETNQALGQMTSLASQGNPFSAGATNFTKGLISGDYNLDQSGLASILGNNPNAISLYGTGIASGADGISTEGDYRSLLGSVDPEFENVVQNTANDLGDQISRQFGGANYGSAGHSDYLTKQVGDVVSKMRSDNFNQNLANKASILGNITGVQGQNIANRLGAAGALSGEQQAGFQNDRGIYGDLANLSQQDIQNRLSGLGQMDSVYASQYLPAQMLAGVGAAKEAKAGEKLQADMDRFAIEDMSDWDRLLNYFGIASGTGAQGGTAVQSVQQPSNPWSSILGGGLLASQFFA